jgi:hypothetical protein
MQRFPGNGRGHVFAGTWILAALGIAILLVGTPSATAAVSPAGTSVHTAPYSGAESASFIGEPIGCGGSLSLPVLPYLNMTSGQAFESIQTSAKSCGTTNTTVYLESATGFTSTPFTTSAELHRLSANWMLNFTVKLVAKPGASQSARAQFAVYFEFQLIDRTTETMYYQNNYPELYSIVSSGTYSHTYTSVSESVYLNATLVKGHSYEYVVQALAAVEVFVMHGTSSASASVNMGSAGRNAFLASVTRT